MPGSSSGLGSRRHSHTPDAGSMAALGATRDRRHSTSSSSDASGSLPDAGPSARQYSNENIEYLPARLAKVTTSKPAANPLQFVKVGPCDLYRSAQEQIRKVEQVKKMKAEVRDEAEDWQSNLDNWKSSRRKRQEHIIERVVEVKKLELEEHDRSRRKSKTFSEILEERRGRKLSLPMYQEEDAHDLSDLGITPGAPSRNGNGDADGGSGSEMGDRDDASAGQADGAQNGHSDGSAGSPEPPAEPPQEYTYERAIQSYVDFAETRVRNGHSAGSRRPQPPPPPPAKPRRDSAPAACAPRPPPASLPNVDVGKRRELFEKAAESASQQQQAARRAPASAKSVRDRLSSLEKQADAAAAPPAPSPPAKPRAGARDRLGSAGSPAGSPVKDAAFQVKLANFEGAGDSPTSPRSPSPGAASAASAAPVAAAAAAAAAAAGAGNGSRRAQLHRSLDSLDVGPGAAASAAADLLSEAFERVQSLQALDCCGSAAPLAAAASSSELLAASSQSGDTDREDSGIHTADVSCSVSQADEPVDEAEPVVPGDADGHDADASEAAGASGDSAAEALDAGDISEETATTVGSEVPPHVDSPGTTPPTSPMSPTPAHAAGAFSGTDSGDEEEQLIAVTAPLPALAAVPEEQLDLSAALVPAMSLPQPLLPQPAAAPQAQTPPAASAEPSAPTVAVVPAPAPAAVPDPVVALVEEIPEPLPQTPAEPPAPQPPPAAFALEPLAPLAPLAAGPLASPGDASQLPPLSLTGDLEIVGGLAFPLGPPTSAEPPKEKPPPPPTELSDEEEPLPAESPLRRLDSTKRIKKEIRRKRSDFLGIAGRDDLDSEEPALTVAPPPDMAALLAEERRLQQQLFRRSLASESDAADAAESRDSGVELERSAAEDAASPEPHSRTNSELFGHTSLTSEEEEVTRREKEIIASLEQEEQWRRGDSIGEQLAERLRVLEMEKAELDRRRVEEEGMRREEERRLAAREAALRLHESTDDSSELQEPLEESSDTGEALRREQARLDAQREHLRELESPILSTPMQQPQSPQHRWSAGPTLQSYGSRQSDIASVPAPVRRPPPPAPPAKPQRMASQEQRERDNSIRSSRVPSADCLTLESNRGNLTTAQSSAVQQSMQPHQMSRQTLQALSAAPRSRLITNDTWIQARRKQESTRPALNTQHWLIQEAEHRRLTEQAQRCAPPPRRPPPPQQQWAHHQPPPPPPPPRPEAKPLPDAIIQTLTQRVQGRTGQVEKKKAASINLSPNREPAMPLKQFPVSNSPANNLPPPTLNGDSQEKMLSVSGKKKCSHCGEELGRGAAMIIESLRLFYHIDCFKCCVCHVQLGDGLMGTDVRVRNSKLHCHNCYSSEDGVKFSCV